MMENMMTISNRRKRTEMLIWKGRKWRIFSISRGGSSWRLTRKGTTLTKSQGTNMVAELCYFLSKNENYITWHMWTCKHQRTVHINFTKALHGIFEINILLQVTYFDGTWSIPTCEQLICIWQLTLLSSIKNICPGREVKSRVNNNGSQLPRPDTIISFRIYIMRKKKLNTSDKYRRGKINIINRRWSFRTLSNQYNWNAEQSWDPSVGKRIHEEDLKNNKSKVK